MIETYEIDRNALMFSVINRSGHSRYLLLVLQNTFYHFLVCRESKNGNYPALTSKYIVKLVCIKCIGPSNINDLRDSGTYYK